MLTKLNSNRKLEIELHKCGSEDYSPATGTLDLCFTSPPYFNCEKYSDEPTQSYKRFPSQNEWLNGFMHQTLANCHQGLKPTGTLIINLAGVKTYPTLSEDFVTMAESNGWKLQQRAGLLLSRMMGTRKDGSAYKTEPVLIFHKKSKLSRQTMVTPVY